jgi:hypothetical protein
MFTRSSRHGVKLADIAPPRPPVSLLEPGVCTFAATPDDSGVVVKFDDDRTSFFHYARGLFSYGSKHIEIIPGQCTHPQPLRTGWQKATEKISRWSIGGGDVFVQKIESRGAYPNQEAHLRAGVNRDVIQIPLDVTGDIWFLHISYVCSSGNVGIRTYGCNKEIMPVARAFRVLKTYQQPHTNGPRILFLAGLTGVESRELKPGDGLRVNQGHIIGASATLKLEFICEPIIESHASEAGFRGIYEKRDERRKNRKQAQGINFRRRICHAWKRAKVLVNSIRSGEGLYLYDVYNRSDHTAYIFLQENRPLVPESPGLVGLCIRYFAYLTRIPKLLGVLSR